MADYSLTIDRLMARLMATYGQGFIRMYEGVDTQAVKAIWARELEGVSLLRMKWAVDNLPERAPNAIQFRNLCSSAPSPHVTAIADRSHVRADPQRVKQALAQLNAARQADSHDSLGWARRLLERHESGERVPRTSLEMARHAVRRNELRQPGP